MTMPPLLRVLRPHQWSKNLLVFVSLLAGHQINDSRLLALTALCFAAFCLAASCSYIVNDLADLRDDQAHPLKCLRPLASGALRPATAAFAAMVLLSGAFGLALAVSLELALCLGGYVLASQAYTFWAKRKLALDIVFLAGLYTVRIIAGVVVSGVYPSFWLLAFSMFLFFSLASLKRYVEIASRGDAALEAFSARAYRAADAAMVSTLGIGSGLVSVLVLAFYLNSREVIRLYATPGLLWLACPLLLYWIARVWMLAGRNAVHDDPIVFALRDPASYVLLGLLACIVVAAT
jgi:4-hydroxybenzoate polyprenyltransferase